MLSFWLGGFINEGKLIINVNWHKVLWKALKTVITNFKISNFIKTMKLSFTISTRHYLHISFNNETFLITWPLFKFKIANNIIGWWNDVSGEVSPLDLKEREWQSQVQLFLEITANFHSNSSVLTSKFFF